MHSGTDTLTAVHVPLAMAITAIAVVLAIRASNPPQQRNAGDQTPRRGGNVMPEPSIHPPTTTDNIPQHSRRTR